LRGALAGNSLRIGKTFHEIPVAALLVKAGLVIETEEA
jgi:hypothetical protein